MGENIKKYVAVDGTPFFRKVDGVARYSKGLLLDLAKKCPDTYFVIIGFTDDRKKQKLVAPQKNIEYFYLPMPRKIYQVLFSRVYPIALDRLVPYNFSLQICPNFTCFPYLSRVEKITFIHDLAFIDLPKTIEPRNLSYLRKRVRWSINRSSIIVCVSHFTKRRVQTVFNVDSNRILVVPPVPDEKFYHSTKISRESLSRKYNLPSKYILTVGTLEPRKNISALIMAFSLLPINLQQKHPLVIVGAKGWIEKYKTLNQYVHFTGFIDDNDMPSIYKGAECFLFPSKYEGFGLPVLEAILAQTPVVSTDIDSVREFAGNTITYTYTNPKSIKDGLQRVLISNDSDTDKPIKMVTEYFKNNNSDVLAQYINKH